MNNLDNNRKFITEEMDERQRFIILIFELFAKITRLQPNQIDDEIAKQLTLIGEYWNFDQIILEELLDDGFNRDHHSYISPNIVKQPFSSVKDQLPWVYDKTSQGETVILVQLPEDLPKSAKIDRQFCEKSGIKSAVVFPLKIGDKIRGEFTLISIQEKRQWTRNMVEQLQYLSDVLSGVLEQKRAGNKQQETIQIQSLLSDVSSTYINLPIWEIKKGIQNDLGKLGQFLGVDRCIFYRSCEDKPGFETASDFAWWPKSDTKLAIDCKKWADNEPDFQNRMAYLFDNWQKGKVVKYSNQDELPDEAEQFKYVHKRYQLKSFLSVPIFVSGSVAGAMIIGTIYSYQSWPDSLSSTLQLFGEVFANALMRMKSEETLQNALSEIKQLKQQIEKDNTYLKEEIKLEHNHDEIIGKNSALKNTLLKVEQVAPLDTTVLILGETGTGKELIARAIHNASQRRDRPLIKVNCAVLTANLVESELFGHEKGAFSHAMNKRVGRFELANGATLFLDEIGELPVELQAKLLRVLQEGEFERVGSSLTIKTDVRIIVATNRNLEEEVEKGSFRRDLWYRLNIFPIKVPPLKDRREDIPLFINWFATKYGQKVGKNFDTIPQKSIDELNHYSWPGNVRELENMIERAVITSTGKKLKLDILVNQNPPPLITHNSGSEKTYQEFEQAFLYDVLIETGWKIEGPYGAAHKLGLKPSTLRNRMKRLSIRRPPP